jgi:hypothetical protein
MVMRGIGKADAITQFYGGTSEMNLDDSDDDENVD